MSYPSIGGKSEKEYAKMLLNLCYNDKEGAEKEVFNAARVFKDVPCSYWRRVFLIIHD